MIMFILAAIAFASSVFAQRQDGQFWPCNPVKNATGSCDPNPGLPTSSYFVDFIKEKAIPENWTISNYATVNFGKLGAEFTYSKRYDSPQLWTDFFIFFGKVTIEARVANGTGMISSAVLMSDDFDEIDFEFSGNNFGDTTSKGKGQNNYFGKGVTGNYDRGGWFDVVDPQETFHTYTIDWSPDRLLWEVDGKVVRTFKYSDSTQTGAYQYPQTPSKFQLGIWAGGDPGQNDGTKAWAGGTTNISAAPYTMYVKSVKIENANPAWAYNWTDESGKWQSIKLLQQPQADGKSTTILPSTSKAVSSSTSGKLSSSTTSIKVTSTAPKSTSTVTVSSKSTTTASVKTSTSIKSTTSTTSKPTTTTSVKSSTSTTTKKASSTSTQKITTTPKPSSTTKCTTTTSTKPKTTTTTTSQQWQWGNWGSWWRNGEEGSNDENWQWSQRQRGWW